MLKLQIAPILSLIVLSVLAIDAVHAQEPDEPLALGPAGFLSAESDFWAPYGVTLSRGGKDVGPGFLALDLSGAVRGSAKAEAHAGHAHLRAANQTDDTAGLVATTLSKSELLQTTSNANPLGKRKSPSRGRACSEGGHLVLQN